MVLRFFFLFWFCLAGNLFAQYQSYPRLQALFDKALYSECIEKAAAYIADDREALYPYFWQLRSYLAIHQLRFHDKKKLALDKAVNIAVKLQKRDAKGYFSETYPGVYSDLLKFGMHDAKQLCLSQRDKSEQLYKKLEALPHGPELEFSHYECLKSSGDPLANQKLSALVETLTRKHAGKAVATDTFESYFAEMALVYARNGFTHKAITTCRSASGRYGQIPKCKAAIGTEVGRQCAVLNYDSDLNTLHSAYSFLMSADSLFQQAADSDLQRLRRLIAARRMYLATDDHSAEVLKSFKAYAGNYKTDIPDTVSSFFNLYRKAFQAKPNYNELFAFAYQTELTRFYQRGTLFDAAKFVFQSLQADKNWQTAIAYLRYCDKAFPKEKQALAKMKTELNGRLLKSMQDGSYSSENSINTDVAATPALRDAQLQQYIRKLQQLLAAGNYNAFARLVQKALLAHPANSSLLALKKQYVLADYRHEFSRETSAIKVFENPPSALKCAPGKPSDQMSMVVLKRLMYVRRLAGIPDTCIFDAAMSRQCQSAALMMASNQMLDHAPPKTWKCYTAEGALAAGSGNLSLGHGFNDALMGQVEDFGSGNYACGHRRWILNPYNRVFGFGSTEDAMCLKVFGTGAKQPENGYVFNDSQFVTWPSADYFPIRLLPERWSFSLEDADFSKAKVSVSLNGKQLKVTQEKLASGYGMNTLVWTIAENIVSDAVYTVSITQVKTSRNQIRKYTYKISFLDAD